MATKDDVDHQSRDGDDESDRGDVDGGVGSDGDSDGDTGDEGGGDGLHPRLRELLQEDNEYEGDEEDRAVMTAAVHELPREVHLHALRSLLNKDYFASDSDFELSLPKIGCWALEVLAQHATNEEVVVAVFKCIDGSQCVTAVVVSVMLPRKPVFHVGMGNGAQTLISQIWVLASASGTPGSIVQIPHFL